MILALMAAAAAVGAGQVAQQDLGKAAGTCRSDETGPAFLVEVRSLRDRMGRLKLEVYPANDTDFLADDSVLVAAGKTFRRVEVPASTTDPLCIRVPGSGRYGVSLLHDRNGNRRFDLSSDGVGFAANPRLGWSKPKVATASAIAGDHLTQIIIVMNYRHGLGMRPESDR